MKRGIAIIMIAAAILLVAYITCSSHGHTFEYNGTWEAKRNLTAQPDTIPAAMEQAARVTLTIKPDGTFDLIDAGLPHGGNIDVEGDHAILTITSVMNEPMEKQSPEDQARNKPIRITPLPDGTLRYYDPGGFDQTGMIMHRVTQEKVPGR